MIPACGLLPLTPSALPACAATASQHSAVTSMRQTTGETAFLQRSSEPLVSMLVRHSFAEKTSKRAVQQKPAHKLRRSCSAQSCKLQGVHTMMTCPANGKSAFETVSRGEDCIRNVANEDQDQNKRINGDTTSVQRVTIKTPLGTNQNFANKHDIRRETMSAMFQTIENEGNTIQIHPKANNGASIMPSKELQHVNLELHPEDTQCRQL